MTNTILVVDDTEENIDVLVDLLGDEYKLLVALDGNRANELAIKNMPDLILLDIMMPIISGFDVCKNLKSTPQTENIPIIFLTANNEEKAEEIGISLGAVDFIRKPFNPVIVKARVKNHIKLKNHQDALMELVRQRTDEIDKTQTVIIKSMGVLAEYRDPETGGHIKRTQNYVKTLAKEMRKNAKYSEYLSNETIFSLYKSAPLHDIGKIAVPDHILLKPGKLTTDEFSEMKLHSVFGRNSLKEIEQELPNETFLKHALEIAFCHHEKWDGSGYPNGLKGEEIPISARLMAIADVYDALVSKRVYKDAYTHEKAAEIIIAGKGKHFDPDMVESFKEIKDEFKKIACKYADE